MAKFELGQRVYLFNSISMKVESDDVYARLYVPVPVEGAEQDGGKSVAEKLAAGLAREQEQYQLCSHQGVLDAEVLFASAADCRAWYRGFFAD